ncbi:NAD-dependent epimerase/dehydratase family protein [Pseudomonas sp. ATCC 13867]|uniref:NAD-dependent epimerase/dehydratase family protein n=1 Tax=Pseudomonas sp. ATCC 13867 TaxID=1294143 RepID=UPI001F432ACF|nr:NAD(P)-dependent oxidoreductase [Pseudomonas sp. ATCC 13867]
MVEQLHKNFSVKVLDLRPPRQNVDFAQANVLDLDTLRKEFAGADAVIHLAAIDFDHQAKPEDYIHVNVQGTWNVLQAANELGIQRVVLCSSISACGLSEAHPSFIPEYLPVDEEHPHSPIQAYSVSKQLMENMAASFVRRGDIQVVCLRPMMVLIPENIAPTVTRADDQASRWLFYYITPEDCARAFEAALRATHIDSGNFFVTAQDSCRAEPTLQWVERVFGKLPEIRDRERYECDPYASIFSGDKARQAFDFVPRSNWREIIGS